MQSRGGISRTAAGPSSDSRFSTASESTPLAAIGALLTRSTGYMPDDSDEEFSSRPSLGHPHHQHGGRQHGSTPAHRVRRKPSPLVTEPSVFLQVPSTHQASHASLRTNRKIAPPEQSRRQQRLTIIDFPTPGLDEGFPPSGTRAQPSAQTDPPIDEGYGRSYSTRQRASPTYPATSRPGLLAPRPNHPARSRDMRGAAPAPFARTPSPASPNVFSHVSPYPLPPPCSPVSPMLAAPPPRSHSSSPSPSPLSSPGTPFAAAHLHDARGRSPTIPDSDSIRGFDIMHEKRALFREGEEEITHPLSPAAFHSPRRRREEVMRGRERMRRGMTTVDFWKRFSVMRVEVEADGKESEWLQSVKSDRGWIRKGILIGLAITVLLAIGIIVIVVVMTNRH